MAYPTVSGPYGFKPINRVDGMPYAGAIRQIPIKSTDNTAIYNGDIVAITTDGTVTKSTVTVDATAAAANYTAGVFVGVQYVNSMGQTVEAQYYPGNAAATSAIAYVVDDPLAAFKAVACYANGVQRTVTEVAVGTNCAVVAAQAGSNITGDSGLAADIHTGQGSATALPFRVIAVVPDTANATGFTEVVLKFNNHQYNNPALAYDY